LGYLDHGKSKQKTLDPDKAPLVRKAFELYASGAHSLDELVEKMYDLGLRSRTGNKVEQTGMSLLLNRRFYIGEIEIKKTGERFIGNHEPLIEPALFERVQEILIGRYPKRNKTHDFVFRRLLACDSCGYSLIGETHKGHVYYRCHNKKCPTTSVRETEIDRVLEGLFSPLQFSGLEKEDFTESLQMITRSWAESKRRIEQTLRADLERIKLQAERLLEAYMDGLLEKQVYEQKKVDIETRRRDIERKSNDSGPMTERSIRSLEKFLELAGNAYLLYKTASKEKKRELLENLTSNRAINAKTIEITLNPAALAVAGRPKYSGGDPPKDTARKRCRFLWKLVDLLSLPPAKPINPL
jgi:site-specific DNA recombinase